MNVYGGPGGYAPGPQGPQGPYGWQGPPSPYSAYPPPVPPPVGRPPSSAPSFLWALAPLYTCGFAAPFTMLYAAIRRRSAWYGAAAAGYAAATGSWIYLSEMYAGVQAPALASLLMVICMVTPVLLGTVHSLAVRKQVFGITPQPSTANEQALAVAQYRRGLRQQARELAQRDPAMARELRVGRPDLPRQYDDGGLIDVNQAPASVIASLPGISPTLADQIVRIIGLIGYSVPIFWLALLSLVLFYAKLQWAAFPGRVDVVYEYSFTPVTGFYLIDATMQGKWDVLWDLIRHIALPAALLGYFSLAYISRMTRSFMLNELSQEYIVAARAKGLSETRIIWRHALRNAAVPLITVIALSYAGLLEGSVLTETVFAWPGLGLYITNSLQNADMNAVLGGTIIIGSVFIGINILSDLLYRTLDPRTRTR